MKVSQSAAVPPAPTPPAPRRVPGEWTRGLDAMLAVMALVVAFLAASVAARNSDLWLSLASGRLLSHGQFDFGGDPFSATGRAWVHWTWLSDLASYGLYTLDTTGGPLVAVKAAFVAAAFAAGLLLRRPGRSLAPWAAFILLGAAASAPHVAALRPAVVSLLFAPLMLAFVVTRLGTGSPRNRLLELALLQFVWANADDDFWYGPFILICALIGEVVDRRRADDDTNWPAVPVKTLAFGLAVSLLACVLNPWFLAAMVSNPESAWMQLVPVEWRIGLPVAPTDGEIAFLRAGPLDSVESSFDRQPASIIGLIAFSIVGMLALIVSATRCRAAFVLIWVGSAILAVLSVKFVPFFCVLTGPIAALLCNAMASRGGAKSEAAASVALAAAGVGRVMLFVLALGLAVLAYPGRLHPRSNDPATAARVEWTLAPDPGQVRAAAALGALPPATGRTINLTASVGNYLAFHAPDVSVFLDGRFRFHRPELPDAVQLRRGLVRVSLLEPDEAEPAFRAAQAILAERAATRLILTGSPTVPTGRQFDPRMAFVITSSTNGWSLARLDGRAAILDKNGATVDFVREAFGAGVEPLPVANFVPPPPRDLGIAGEFVTRPQPLPIEADDAAVTLAYLELVGQRNRSQAEFNARLGNGALGGGAFAGLSLQVRPAAEEFALATLALRSARRAVAAAPDRAEGYQQLAAAYASPLAPVDNDSPIVRSLQLGERDLQRIAAIRRALDRMPLPGTGTPYESFEATRLTFDLANLYQETQQFDAAKDATDAFADYFSKLPPEIAVRIAMQIANAPPNTEPSKILEAFRKQLEARQDQLRQQVQQAEDAVARAPDAPRRFDAYQQVGLPLHAVAIYNEQKEAFASRGLAAEVAAMLLDLRAGRIEQAANYLGSHRDSIEAELAQNPTEPMVQALGAARGILARLVGDYPTARAGVPSPAFPPPPAGFNPLRPAYAALGAATALVGPSPLIAATPLGAEAKVPLFDAIIRDQNALRLLNDESRLAQDRATLALVEGRVAEARALFAQAASPHGVAIETLGDFGRAATVRTYLDLIERAGK